jgi:hypothetical protein
MVHYISMFLSAMSGTGTWMRRISFDIPTPKGGTPKRGASRWGTQEQGKDGSHGDE